MKSREICTFVYHFVLVNDKTVDISRLEIFENQHIVTKTNERKKKESDSEKMCGTPLGKKALEINPGPN